MVELRGTRIELRLLVKVDDYRSVAGHGAIAVISGLIGYIVVEFLRKKI